MHVAASVVIYMVMKTDSVLEWQFFLDVFRIYFLVKNFSSFDWSVNCNGIFVHTTVNTNNDCGDCTVAHSIEMWMLVPYLELRSNPIHPIQSSRRRSWRRWATTWNAAVGDRTSVEYQLLVHWSTSSQAPESDAAWYGSVVYLHFFLTLLAAEMLPVCSQKSMMFFFKFCSDLYFVLFHAAYIWNTVWTLECIIGLVVAGTLQVTVVIVTDYRNARPTSNNNCKTAFSEV